MSVPASVPPTPAVSSQGAELLRALGGWERLFWLVDQSHSVNFVIIAHVDGELDSRILGQALSLVQSRHPLLGARIVSAEPPVFTGEGVPPIPLRAVPRRSADQWREEVEQELNTPLHWSQGPLVRAVLLLGESQSDILLTFHHSAADGRSGMYVLRDLLAFSAALAEGDRVEPGAVRSPPSVEELLSAQVGGFRSLGRGARVLGSILLGLGRRPQRLPTHDKEARGRAALLHHALSVEENARLRERCRQKQAPLHGVLCGALLRGVADQLDALEGAPRARFLGCYSPIDLQESFRDTVERDAVGYLTGMGLTFHRIDASADALPLAREVGLRLRSIKANGDVLVATRIQSRVASRWDQKTAARNQPPVAATVSNLRDVDIAGRFGALSLTGLHFALSSTSWGTTPVLTVATHQGRMSLDMTYSVPWVREEWARRVFDRALEEIHVFAT